jgi:signal transduction histidine kinase
MTTEASQTDLIRRISSVVGHELRNPLAALNNSAYFVKAKLSAVGSLDPKVEKHLGIMASEIGRADRMIADMLTYSRALELSRVKTDLVAAARSTVETADRPAGVKIAFKAPKNSVEADVDAARLVEALRRLIDNAVEACGEKGAVTVSVGKEKGGAVIEVRDTGGGVKPELLPHLFEPFWTGKPRGLGLGLALARKIVEAHGGRVEGINEAGGARFRLSVPIHG